MWDSVQLRHARCLGRVSVWDVGEKSEVEERISDSSSGDAADQVGFHGHLRTSAQRVLLLSALDGEVGFSPRRLSTRAAAQG